MAWAEDSLSTICGGDKSATDMPHVSSVFRFSLGALHTTTVEDKKSPTCSAFLIAAFSSICLLFFFMQNYPTFAHMWRGGED